jgi:hypothetical protein
MISNKQTIDFFTITSYLRCNEEGPIVNFCEKGSEFSGAIKTRNFMTTSFIRSMEFSRELIC